MGRTCTVCTHDEHHAINVDLLGRVPYRHIAARYSVSTGALRQHSQEHIPQLLLKAYEAIERDDAEYLARELVKVKGGCAPPQREGRGRG
jgi:hypothetical protein